MGFCLILCRSLLCPNFEEVRWHIAFGLCLRVSVHPFITLFDAYHYIMNRACMLGFWNFIYGFLLKKSLNFFFFLIRVMPFWNYAPLKKSEWNLVSKISRKVLESWPADRVRWVDYLINFWTNFFKLFRSYGLLQIWAFQTCQQDISKTIR